jgi:aminoglycoside phosphotransferase (APT) family kinase protein
MTYGFDLAPDLHEQLRGDPPPETLQWIEEQVGSKIAAVRALEGGMSSAVHLLTTDRSDQLVLRRYVREWTAEEPWIPVNEARVLGLLSRPEAERVPAPHLLAADPDGSATGTPAVVMSALPGAMVWDPADLDVWLRRLASALPAIHAVPVADGMLEWQPYEPENDLPPAWSKHPDAWKKAAEAFAGPRPEFTPVFVHRDYHPGNVLWTGERITGIVDWASSCIGPAEEDVAHCRMNLALHHGQEAADRFLELWMEAAGRWEYDPYWDLADVVSIADDEPNEALDEFVAAAANRL